MNFLQWLRSQFKRIPLEEMISDELHQAEIDLLEAEHQLEHWETNVPKLRKRVDRLRAKLKPSDPIPLTRGVQRQG